jgi:hypothetical protein
MRSVPWPEVFFTLHIRVKEYYGLDSGSSAVGDGRTAGRRTFGIGVSDRRVCDGCMQAVVAGAMAGHWWAERPAEPRQGGALDAVEKLPEGDLFVSEVAAQSLEQGVSGFWLGAARHNAARCVSDASCHQMKRDAQTGGYDA